MILTLDVDKSCSNLVGETFEIIADIHKPIALSKDCWEKHSCRTVYYLQMRCRKECAAGPFLSCFFACFKDSLYKDTVYKGLAKCKSCAENVVECGLAKCDACHTELDNFHPKACFNCMEKKCKEEVKCGKHVGLMGC